MAKRGRGVNAKGRSKGNGQFVPLTNEMLESAAWCSLSPACWGVYPALRKRYNGSNNGDLSLSCREGAEKLNLAIGTVQRALKELEAKGFLKKTADGHFHGRKAATYAVTDRPIGTHPPTNDWRNWRPPKSAKKAERHSSGDTQTAVACQEMNASRNLRSPDDTVRPN